MESKQASEISKDSSTISGKNILFVGGVLGSLIVLTAVAAYVFPAICQSGTVKMPGPKRGVSLAAPSIAHSSEPESKKSEKTEQILTGTREIQKLQTGQLRDQVKRAELLKQEIRQVRDALIRKRYEYLDGLAQRRGWKWGRHIPEAGQKNREQYLEWKFLHGHFTGGHGKKLSRDKNKYTPKWMKR